MSFTSQMETARRESVASAQDPWRDRIKPYVANLETISTNALLDYLRAGHTIHNARRLAPIMRELGFIRIMSRRLMPAGFRDTVSRGWTRPTRPEK